MESSVDQLSDVDAEIRAFVRDLGLPGARRRSAADELENGTRIAGHLEVLRPLGRGASGIVYLARDTALRRDVALKIVQTPTPIAAARLEREAQAMARLSHPNVVGVHEVGAFADGFYIAMEHVDGGTMRRWLAEAPRSWTAIVAAFVQAARGLHAAHLAGLLHRDFKPDNVLIGAGAPGSDVPRVVVGDFGLARARHDADEVTSTAIAATDDASVTDGIAGTPAYLAPEVVLRREVGPLADQFALGVSLFEALCKQRPYPPPGAWTATPESLRRFDPELPTWLRTVVLRAIALDPAVRFPDVDALARALEHGLGRASRRRRGALVVAIGGLAVALGIGLGTRMPADPCVQIGDEIDTLWNAEQRTRIAQAIETTASPLGTTAIATIDERLAMWALAWRAQRLDACVATRVRGEQSEARMDVRMDCLDALAVELGVLTDLLGEADAEIVARTDDLLARLPAPSQCADVELLEGVEAVPAVRRERYDPLFRAVATAEEQLAAGRVARALAQLDELVVAIEAEGFRGLAARARLARGMLLFDLGRRDEARVELARAQALALVTDDRRLLAQAMLQLARVAGKTSAGTDEALQLLDTLAALIDEGNPTGLDAIDLDAARVDVLAEGGRLDEGERVARAALQHLPDDHPRRNRLLNGLGVVLTEQYRLDDAIEVQRQAVATAERVRGVQHPAVAMALGNLATALTDDARTKEARDVLARALAIREAALGAQAPVVGDTHRQLGDALREGGDLDGARREYELALAIHRAANDDAGVVMDTAHLADAVALLGEEPQAIRLLEDLLPIAERQYGAESLNVARLEVNLAAFLWRVSQLEAARRHGDRAILLLERLGRTDGPELGIHYLNHARVLDELSEPEAGLEVLDRAERIFAAALPPDAPEHAYVSIARADILPGLGRLVESIELRGEAIDTLDRVRGSDHPETIAQRFMQGRDLLQAGDTARARDVLERAYAPLAHVQINPTSDARIRMLLAQALWPIPSERPRARALARDARNRYRTLTDSEFAAELDTWMTARGIR